MIIKNKSELRIRISLIIGAVVFLFGGIDSLDQNNLVLAISNFLLAAANIAGAYYIRKLTFVNVILWFLNSGLAFLIAISYFSLGKKELPFAWAVVGVLYLVVGIINYKKQKVKIETSNISN